MTEEKEARRTAARLAGGIMLAMACIFAMIALGIGEILR